MPKGSDTVRVYDWVVCSAETKKDKGGTKKSRHFGYVCDIRDLRPEAPGQAVRLLVCWAMRLKTGRTVGNTTLTSSDHILYSWFGNLDIGEVDRVCGQNANGTPLSTDALEGSGRVRLVRDVYWDGDDPEEEDEGTFEVGNQMLDDNLH